MKFFDELKRRNVIKETIAYIVVAWVFLQVTTLVLTIFEAPSWFSKTLTFIVALGLPVWIFFSWAYQVTPEGFKKTEKISEDQCIISVSNKRLDILIIISLMVAIAVAFFNKPTNNIATQTIVNNALALNNSIAVLPFLDMSPNKDQEYFSDGLSEELLNLLSKIPDLKVIGRTSSFSFKGKNEDLRSIAQKLGVVHILEGSVRKDGNKIRVTAKLIRATDGSQLWSDTYDRDLEGIFQLQDDIAGAVVKELKLKLHTPISNTSLTNPEVYNLILQGNYFAEKRDKESLYKSLDFYMKALAIDSLNARSWASVANYYNHLTSWGLIDKNQGVEKAMNAATKSIELDKTLAEGHMVLGEAKLWDFDWVGAEVEFQKARNIEPANPDLLRIIGILYRCTGRFDKGILLNKQSIILDPVKPIAYFNYGHLLLYANHLEEAMLAFKKVLELNPQFPRAHFFLGITYLLQEKYELAIAEIPKEANEAWRKLGLMLEYQRLGRAKEVDNMLRDYIIKFKKDEMYQIAQIYAFRGDKDKAFEWLEKSYDAQYIRLNFFKGDPLLKNLEGDPRHKAFLKKMNLPVD